MDDESFVSFMCLKHYSCSVGEVRLKQVGIEIIVGVPHQRLFIAFPFWSVLPYRYLGRQR